MFHFHFSSVPVVVFSQRDQPFHHTGLRTPEELAGISTAPQSTLPARSHLANDAMASSYLGVPKVKISAVEESGAILPPSYATFLETGLQQDEFNFKLLPPSAFLLTKNGKPIVSREEELCTAADPSEYPQDHSTCQSSVKTGESGVTGESSGGSNGMSLSSPMTLADELVEIRLKLLQFQSNKRKLRYLFNLQIC